MTDELVSVDIREGIHRALNLIGEPLAELLVYLARERGDTIHLDWFGGNDETVEQEFAEFVAQGKSAEDFYRDSQTMLYHLTWFGEDQWKKPYRRIITEILPAPARILEYGCGIGADGIGFAQRGYDVSFMDFDSRCVDFLKWRLKWRKWANPVYAIGAEDIPHDFDLVYAFDVLEHTPDPLALLQEIETYGKVIAVNLLHTVPLVADDYPHLHYGVDVNAIADYIRSHGEVIAERELDYALYFIYRPLRAKQS